jgi:hypothetical protein
MKKIAQAILFLTLVGVLILSTQISCQKANAQTPTNQTVAAANLILLGKGIQVAGQPYTDSGKVIQTTVNTIQFSVANIDGSNIRQIPITLPSSLYVGSVYGTTSSGYLTPGGQTIVFNVHDQPNKVFAIYSCSIDGSNLKKVIDLDSQTQLIGSY